MSIQIIVKPSNLIVRQTICDDCKVVLDEVPAEPHDHPGTTLMVCNWCRACSPKHSFPMDQPVKEVRGMTIVNPDAIAKVRIET